MALAPQTLDQAFKAIEAAAVAGERCPQTARDGMPGLRPGATTALAVAGRVSFEVFAHNWRVATIRRGPHAGKCTAPPPNPRWKAYFVIDAAGARRIGA